MNFFQANRPRFEYLLGICLRTPGLFIIDYCWHLERGRFGFRPSAERHHYLTSFLTNLVLLNGFLLLLLPIKIIRSLYSHFICGSLLLIAHFLSHYYVHLEEQPQLADLLDINRSIRHAMNRRVGEFPLLRSGYERLRSRFDELLIAQQLSFLAINVVIGVVVTFLLQGPQKPLIPVVAWYTLPVVARLLDVSTYYLEVIHNTSSILVFFTLLQYCYHRLPQLFARLKIYYTQLISQAERNSVTDMLISTVSKIFVPTHFLLFWAIAFAIKLRQHIEATPVGDTSSWSMRLLIVLSNLCTTPVSLISTAIMITYCSYFVLYCIKLYLWGRRRTGSIFSGSRAGQPATNDAVAMGRADQGELVGQAGDPAEQRMDQHIPEQLVHAAQPQLHTGWEEGLTTLLLATLTGITELKQSARIAVLTIILFVVISSLLQSMLDIAEPIILSLSTHHGKSAVHHLKVLLFCAFLFVFPLQMTWLLAQMFPVDFWMAVVLSTSVLTSAQVLDLLIIHCLLWYDATRSEPWAPLDELVYCVRGIAKLIEIVVAALVVVAGLHEAIYHRFNWTNVLILTVHCYFNVLLRFQAGYANFKKRRSAVRKSNQLANATQEQLTALNDVCSICFMQLVNEHTSVHTQCSHFFHRICLRRWLCFQDRCPICSRSVYNEPVKA